MPYPQSVTSYTAQQISGLQRLHNNPVDTPAPILCRAIKRKEALLDCIREGWPTDLAELKSVTKVGISDSDALYVAATSSLLSIPSNLDSKRHYDIHKRRISITNCGTEKWNGSSYSELQLNPELKPIPWTKNEDPKFRILPTVPETEIPLVSYPYAGADRMVERSEPLKLETPDDIPELKPFNPSNPAEYPLSRTGTLFNHK